MPTNKFKDKIRNIPDFPKPGIQFKDITTLLSDSAAFQEAIDLMSHLYLTDGIEAIVGIEARGFVVGAALAHKLGTGVILARKAGKLPYKTISQTYDLEYGTDCIEIHEDAISPGMRVLLVDDMLATGGTISAALNLLKTMGANVLECCFLMELAFLKGRERLKGEKVFSLIQFDD